MTDAAEEVTEDAEEHPGVRVIHVPLFNDKVLIYTDQDAWQAHRDRTSDGEPLGVVAGATARLSYPDGTMELAVGYFDGELGTLVHELTHAAVFVLQRHGIDPQNDNAEVLARIMDHLFTEATAAK